MKPVPKNTPATAAPPPRPAQPGRLKPERVQLQLANLPGWSVQPGGRAIVRHYPLPETRQALSFLDAVGALGRAQGRLPDVALRTGSATVSVPMPQAGWLAKEDYELALALCEPQQ